jgi:hypothetical protein
MRVGAALTKPGRANTARWCGFGERGGKEYARKQRDHVPQRLTGSNLVGYGPEAVRTRRSDREVRAGGELLGSLVDVRREATVKCCGVAVATPQG